jgi:hypothetical protein
MAHLDCEVRRVDDLASGLIDDKLAPSRDQRCAAIGELHVGAALVQPQPTQRNGALNARAEVLASATGCEERRIDAFDVDAAILRRLDRRSRSRPACVPGGQGWRK